MPSQTPNWRTIPETGFAVLDSDGNSFNTTLYVKDSDGNSFFVDALVKNSSGAGYDVSNTSIAQNPNWATI